MSGMYGNGQDLDLPNHEPGEHETAGMTLLDRLTGDETEDRFLADKCLNLAVPPSPGEPAACKSEASVQSCKGKGTLSNSPVRRNGDDSVTVRPPGAARQSRPAA